MPAVSPFAATASAPTSVGGVGPADSGAFAKALARAEDRDRGAADVRAAPRSGSATHGAPVRNRPGPSEAETAAPEPDTEKTSPWTPVNATGTEVDDRPADGAASEEPVESADDATDAALPSNQFTPTVARNNVALAPTAAAEAADGDLAQQAQAAADESATPDGDGEIDAVAAAKDAAAAEALEATATAPAPSTSASAASAMPR